MKKIFMHVFGLLLAGLALGVAGCGPATSSAPRTTPLPNAQPTTVQVTLTEFQIETSLAAFQVGVPYRFVVTNKGTVNHDFSISPPVSGHHGSVSAQDAHKDALAVIDANDLPPNTTRTIDLTFRKPMSLSEIELACHTAGHYESGMRTPIRVAQN